MLLLLAESPGTEAADRRTTAGGVERGCDPERWKREERENPPPGVGLEETGESEEEVLEMSGQDIFGDLPLLTEEMAAFLMAVLLDLLLEALDVRLRKETEVSSSPAGLPAPEVSLEVLLPPSPLRRDHSHCHLLARFFQLLRCCGCCA